MSTVSPASRPFGLDVASHAIAEQVGTSARTRRAAVALVLIALGATALRGWDMARPYASSDQATLPSLIHHSYGVRWLIERSYGPVTETVNRAFAGLLSALHLPIGETADRFPGMLIGVAQVLVTYPLMKRLRRSTGEAVVGSLVATVLPLLVTDSRMIWGWGFLSMWLFTGSVALWATLAYLDDRRPIHLAVAGCALTAHCLSNVYAFALPATLMVLWLKALWGSRRSNETVDDPDRSPISLAAALVGFVLPCVVALAIIIGAWWLTGHGQIGHLIEKHQHGTAGFHWDQIARMPVMWSKHYGYLSGIVAAAGLIAYTFARHDRRRLMGLWAWLGLLPVWLLSDWERIGYASAYFIETSYAAGLLGVCLVFDLCRRLADRRLLRGCVAAAGVLAITHTAAGTIDDCVGLGRLRPWTGITNCPMTFRQDIGCKGAGGYVREFVPIDAAVLSLHGNRGCEAPVTEYYLGRRALAGHDQNPRILPDLLAALRAETDAILTPADHADLLKEMPEFERVCTIRVSGEPVLFVYARSALDLPVIDEEASELNRRYDERFMPRHIPMALPAPAGYGAKLLLYQQTVRQLKQRAVPFPRH